MKVKFATCLLFLIDPPDLPMTRLLKSPLEYGRTRQVMIRDLLLMFIRRPVIRANAQLHALDVV